MATTSYTTGGRPVPAAADYQAAGELGAMAGPAASAGGGAGGATTAQESTYDAQTAQGDPNNPGARPDPAKARRFRRMCCGWGCVALVVVVVVLLARSGGGGGGGG